MNPRFLAIGVAWVVAVAAVVAGWAIFVASGGLPQYKGGQSTFVTFAILSAPALGALVLRRHPREWTGPLLCACVLAAMLAAIRTDGLGFMSQLAGVIALVTVLLPAVIAMTHPALQTPRHITRFILWCWWLSAIGGLAVASVVFATGSVPTAWWYTANPGPGALVATTLMAVHAVIVVAAVAGTAVFAVSRYRAMPVGGRAPLRPLVVPLIGWAAATAAAAGWTLIAGLGHPAAEFSEPGNTIFVVLPAVLMYVLTIGICWIDVMVRRPTRSPFTAVQESGVTGLARPMSSGTCREPSPTHPSGCCTRSHRPTVAGSRTGSTGQARW